MRPASTPGFWARRPVFVTGATGLLGSTLCRLLVARGAEVAVLIRDRIPRSNFSLLGLERKVNTVRGAVEDAALLERAINEYEADTVFHLAAQTIVGTANRGPLSTFESNIRGTWCLLEACRRNPAVRRVVVSTSDKAYGEQAKLPYDESMPMQGRHPYDVSKSCADLLARSYFHSFGLPVVVARCANLFGGGDLNFNRLIPGGIRSILDGERPVIRSDGNFIRDYLHVEDGAEALLRSAERLEAGRLGGEAFNFGLGVQKSALAVTRTLLKIMGRSDLKPKILNQASNEIRRQYLSSRKAARVLGWKPRRGFVAGLNETVAWYKAFFANQPDAR